MFIQTLHSLQLAGRYIGDFGNFFSGFAKRPRVSGELRNGFSLHAGFYDLILFFPVSSFILILDRCV